MGNIKDDTYSVKNGYKALIHSQRWDEVELPLKLYWDPSCLPKDEFFLWLAYQNSIPTTDGSHKMGFEGPSRCVLCRQNREDTNHILLCCLYTQHCWDWLRYMLGWHAPMPNYLVDLLNSWPINIFKGVYNSIWNIFPSILTWEVWKEKNRRLLRDQEMQPEEIVNKIEASIVKTLNSHLRKSQKEEGSFSS